MVFNKSLCQSVYLGHLSFQNKQSHFWNNRLEERELVVHDDVVGKEESSYIFSVIGSPVNRKLSHKNMPKAP